MIFIFVLTSVNILLFSCTGGGGVVGGGVYRALFPGDAGGGGAEGVVHPIQGPPLSEHPPAAGADQSARSGCGRGRARRRLRSGHGGEFGFSQSEARNPFEGLTFCF